MLTCSYCGTELIGQQDKVCCPFCNAIYDDSGTFGSISLDFKRTKKTTFKGHVDIDDISKPIDALNMMHTIDLILALRLARTERTQAYYLVRVINKTADEISSGRIKQMDTDDLSKDAGDMYMEWTRRMWVIENLLIDRMGFFPERIDDDFIIRMIKQRNRSISKPMKISRKRQSTFKS